MGKRRRASNVKKDGAPEHSVAAHQHIVVSDHYLRSQRHVVVFDYCLRSWRHVVVSVPENRTHRVSSMHYHLCFPALSLALETTTLRLASLDVGGGGHGIHMLRSALPDLAQIYRQPRICTLAQFC
ncbi:hypothetical protein ACLOJK_015143, partial [Asimina triloba]